MKKWLCLALAMVMIISFGACGSRKNTDKTDVDNTDADAIDAEDFTKSLYEHGLEVVSLMAEMTRSDEYVGVFTDSDDIVEMIQGIREGDFSTTKAVYSVSVSRDRLMYREEIGDLDGMSEELKRVLYDRVFESLITQINGLGGAVSIAASSVCTVEKAFVNREVTDNVIYLYTYENAAPVAVTFVVGEDGAVSASGWFILYEEFACDSEEEIEASLGVFDVEVREVTEK